MRDVVSFYAALSDQTRLRLLSLMTRGELCVCHLQGVLRTNQPKISRHLACLRKAGLVEARRDGRWTHYRLKKLEGAPGKILSQTLNHLKLQPEARRDFKRLKKVAC